MNKLDKFMKILFPEYTKCIICSKELNEDKLFTICDDCLETLPFIEKPICSKCGMHINGEYTVCLNCKTIPRHFEKNLSVFAYSKQMPSLILDFKFNKKRYLYKPFSRMLVEKFKDSEINVDLIMPVPLHKDKLKERGYNQAELLTMEFKELNIPIITDNLIRIKYNAQQSLLSKAERIKNLSDSFAVSNKPEIKGKNILVIDDIFTTGATLNEVSKTLIEAGANKVYCLTLCNAHYNPEV